MRLATLFLPFAVLAGCAPRATTRGAGVSQADSVIALYYAAIGGHERLDAIATRHMVGTYEEGRLTAATDIAWSRTRRRVNVHAPGFEYSEGFDGSVWEFNHLTQHAVHDTGAAEAAGRHGAEFDESFVDYASKGSTVSYMGRDTLDGRPVARVRVTLADGYGKEYYFDDSTHLIAGMRKAMPLHATGAAIETITMYGDWQRHCGVRMPHEFVERNRAGTLMNTLHWNTIECNVALADSALAMPVAR